MMVKLTKFCGKEKKILASVIIYVKTQIKYS